MYLRHALREDANNDDSPDLLRRYIRDLSTHTRLTIEEESELSLRAYENKDPEAQRQLVLDNLHVVVKMALKYQTEGCSLLDLIQEGNVGMLVAVNRYNPYKGTRFSTYAFFWIKSFILHYIMDNISLIRFGKTVGERRLFFTLHKETAMLEAKGVRPTPALLAQLLRTKEEDVVQMQTRLSEQILSFETPVIRGDKSVRLQDMLKSQEDTEATVRDRDASRRIETALMHIRSMLNKKEVFILDHRIMEDEPLTLREIGDNLGVTRERARQIEKEVIRKLRKEFGELVERRSGQS